MFTDDELVVDPIADTSTPDRTLRQVVALAAYKNAIQTFEHFSERREQDGGVRFKGKEYVQDFSYDCWVIDQLSEGVVPLFLPAETSNLTVVSESFAAVADAVAAARTQTGVAPSSYPLSGPDTLLSRPEWFHSPYTSSTAIDTGLDVEETGDVAHRNPILGSDDPIDRVEIQEMLAEIQESLGGIEETVDQLTEDLGNLQEAFDLHVQEGDGGEGGEGGGGEGGGGGGGGE